MLEAPNRTVDVYPYSGEYQPLKGIPVATVGTVYTDPVTGQQALLIFHETLFFGERLQDSLLCPNQLRDNGVIVHDVPRQFDKDSTHSVYVPEHKMRIPLEIRGIISCFATSQPMAVDLDELPHIVMTSSAPWNPTSTSFAEAEEKFRMLKSVNTVSGLVNLARPPTRLIAAFHAYTETTGIPLESRDVDIYDLLMDLVIVASDDIPGKGTSGFSDETLYPDRCHRIHALTSKDMQSILTPELLAQRWCIGLPTAKRTLQVTTQTGVRNILVPSERKVRKKAPWLKFPSMKGQFYTDSMYSKVKSLHGDIGGTVFTNGHGLDAFYPWKSRKEHADSLMNFIHDFGVPQTIVSDGAPDLTDGRTRQVCREYPIQQKITVPYSPWQNLAEACIREMKQRVRQVMRHQNVPTRLWSYAAKWAVAIRRLTALDIPQLNGRVAMEAATGSTPDISAYALFDFYQPVWYYTPTASFPHHKKVIGRWLGVAETCTDDLAYYILPPSCQLKIRKDVWAITADELAIPSVQAELAALDQHANSQLLGSAPDGDSTFPKPDWDVLSHGEDEDEPFDPDQVKHEADDYTPKELDEYLSALVMIPQGRDITWATVTRRIRDSEGQPMGKRHPNPILNTRLYEVEFPDGSTEAITANMIAENLYAQMDKEGNLYQILKEIVDHEKDHRAVTKDNGWVRSGNGQQKPRITTVGWRFQVEWADGSTSWVPLKDLKESNPVEVAEYAVANQISEEAAFAWWVRPTLRKRDRIIRKVKSRYWERTHKFGIEMPKSVPGALAIDRRNGNSLWRNAIEKEMKNVMAAFEFKDDDVMPIGHKKIDVHMIFDVKSDLTRKARLVAGGHQTDPPKESTYSSVVSRDSVRIAFTLAALNGLEVLAADIQNAYLNAGTKERVYTMAGPEFGANVGRPVLIVRALYGLKSSGARWRDHISGTLRSGGFKSCYADPDIWMRPNCKPDGTKYWEYVLCYVDDILVVSHDPKKVMDYLEKSYTLKAGSVGAPKDYLGAQVTKYSLAPNGHECWAMSSNLYIKRAIADVEKELAQIDRALKSKASTPLSAGYRPELDTSDELDPKRANYFQGVIGVLRWIVELGRVDILVAVAMLSRYLAMPRTGHLDEALHVFAYLKQYIRSTLVLDDTAP
jgi:hypothetical protein